MKDTASNASNEAVFARVLVLWIDCWSLESCETEGENTDRAFNGLTQLFNHRCSIVAACPMPSIFLINSTSTSPLPVTCALAFVNVRLLRYSRLPPLVTLLSL